MTGSESAGLARAREDLAAARLLHEAGFHAQCTSRAYFAAFHAAEEALLRVGETRSKHSGVVAAFGEHVVKRHGFDPEIARGLRLLFQGRAAADYDTVAVPAEQAADAIARASAFVDAVADWLRARA